MISPIWYDEFMREMNERGLLTPNVYTEYTVRKGDPILVFPSYEHLYEILVGGVVAINSLRVRAVREYTYKLIPVKLGHSSSIGVYFFKGHVIHTALGGMVAWAPDRFL